MIPSTSGTELPNHPHPNPLPEYRERGQESHADTWSRQLRPWMKPLVHTFEPILIDVSVDLCGADVAVAQEFLHDA